MYIYASIEENVNYALSRIVEPWLDKLTHLSVNRENAIKETNIDL